MSFFLALDPVCCCRGLFFYFTHKLIYHEKQFNHSTKWIRFLATVIACLNNAYKCVFVCMCSWIASLYSFVFIHLSDSHLRVAFKYEYRDLIMLQTDSKTKSKLIGKINSRRNCTQRIVGICHFQFVQKQTKPQLTFRVCVGISCILNRNWLTLSGLFFLLVFSFVFNIQCWHINSSTHT